MLKRSDLNEWINGNRNDFDKSTLILIASYWETYAKYNEQIAEEQIEEDDDV
jgi:hypothetical protein